MLLPIKPQNQLELTLFYWMLTQPPFRRSNKWVRCWLRNKDSFWNQSSYLNIMLAFGLASSFPRYDFPGSSPTSSKPSIWLLLTSPRHHRVLSPLPCCLTIHVSPWKLLFFYSTYRKLLILYKRNKSQQSILPHELNKQDKKCGDESFYSYRRFAIWHYS